MVENQDTEKKEEFECSFSHLAPRPIDYAQMLARYLGLRFGEPQEVRFGTSQQLVYNNNGTQIIYDVNDVGVTKAGVEAKVKISFHSTNKKSIESITSERAWENFDLNKDPVVKTSWD